MESQPAVDRFAADGNSAGVELGLSDAIRRDGGREPWYRSTGLSPASEVLSRGGGNLRLRYPRRNCEGKMRRVSIRVLPRNSIQRTRRRAIRPLTRTLIELIYL